MSVATTSRYMKKAHLKLCPEKRCKKEFWMKRVNVVNKPIQLHEVRNSYKLSTLL